MKTLLTLLLICGLTVPAFAQTNPNHKHHKKGATNAAPADATPPPDPAAEQTKQVAEFQKTFAPTDPWRVLNDKTNFAKGPEWVQFEGIVASVTADGLVVRGSFGPPLFYMLPNNGGATSGNFFLSNYPRQVAIGQALSRYDRLVAMKSGDKNNMPDLEYGAVYVPELTEAQKAQLSQAKVNSANKVLAWQKELAEKGDAYGQYKMGMRYLNGDGVDKDAEKGKDFLTKAAAQGNRDAADELKILTPN